MKVSEVNGTLKVHRIASRNKTIQKYLVTLFRGSEEKLLAKLDGDISNLVTFCDNNYSFENLDRICHYGGCVTTATFEGLTTFTVEVFVD